MKKAVLFDMDGILCDSERFYMEGTLTWMKKYGYTGDIREISCIIGTTMAETYRILEKLLEGRLTIPQVREQNERFFYEESPLNYASIMFADVPAMLEKLQEHGYLMACCSSSPAAEVHRALDEMGISGYFKAVLADGDIPRAKPFPDIYLTAAERLGVMPQECIVYEDSAAGCEAGKQAGMYVIARRDERFRQDIHRADLIVNNITEMTETVIGGLYAGSN